MKIAVTGSSGLIGSALVRRLRASGHEVLSVVRSPAAADAGSATWRPHVGQIDAAALEGIDAAVNLAGEPLVGRWTSGKKHRIRQSRVQGTELICRTLAQQAKKAKVILSASAVGYYGNRGEEWLEETSAAGEGFLASVCRMWEEAAEPARQAGIRVVHLRFGIVLSSVGGALEQALKPFRLGLGGRLGSGKQYWSWISLEDVLAILARLLEDDSLAGPVNVVSPQPVTNRQFTQTLSRVLKRPAPVPVPAFALRLALGSMADEAILASARVAPARLRAASYVFRHETLESALKHCLTQEAVPAI